MTERVATAATQRQPQEAVNVVLDLHLLPLTYHEEGAHEHVLHVAIQHVPQHADDQEARDENEQLLKIDRMEYRSRAAQLRDPPLGGQFGPLFG
jgi:hypothetical protein